MFPHFRNSFVHCHNLFTIHWYDRTIKRSYCILTDGGWGAVSSDKKQFAKAIHIGNRQSDPSPL